MPMFQRNYADIKSELELYIAKWLKLVELGDTRAAQFIYSQNIAPCFSKYREALWTPKVNDPSSRQGILNYKLPLGSYSVVYLEGNAKINLNN